MEYKQPVVHACVQANNLDGGGELAVSRSGVSLIMKPELLGFEQMTSAKISNPKSDAGLYFAIPLAFSFLMMPKFSSVS